MRTWKYALLGVIGKTIMVITDSKAIWAVIPIFALGAWWVYNDIRHYLSGRKLKRESKGIEHGDI